MHATSTAPVMDFATHDSPLVERRDWVRFPSNLDALCWCPDDDHAEPWGAVVRDISAGGVGLFSREPVAVGSVLKLKLHSRYVNLTGSLEAEVISVQSANPEEWIVGCKFVRELDAQERRSLL